MGSEMCIRDSSWNEDGFMVTMGADVLYVGRDSHGVVWGGLSPGVTYCFQVLAYNAAGDSPPSTSSCATTASSPPPNPPSNLTATPTSSTRIDLSWHDNSTNEVGFIVTNGVTNHVVGPNVTTDHWDVGPDQYMCFNVLAQGTNESYSAWSNQACTTTPL